MLRRHLIAGSFGAWIVGSLRDAAAAPDEPQIVPIDAAQFADILASHRGDVVIVNFWATWCRPCLKEIPELTALAEKYHGRGLRLLPVSLDDPGDLPTVVTPFLAKWFPGFHSYMRLTSDMDAMVSVIDPAWNELLPTTYILDRAGKVRTRMQGGKSAAEFAAAVLPLLNQTS